MFIVIIIIYLQIVNLQYFNNIFAQKFSKYIIFKYKKQFSFLFWFLHILFYLQYNFLAFANFDKFWGDKSLFSNIFPKFLKSNFINYLNFFKFIVKWCQLIVKTK
jgi:hypothetical protein